MHLAIRRKLRALPLAAGVLLVPAALCCQGAVAQFASQASPQTDSVAARKAAHQPYTPPPAGNMGLYPPTESAGNDLAAGLARAKAEHKRVILDFGGDWCGDCKVLDIYFRQQPNADLLARYFVKVNINIGHED